MPWTFLLLLGLLLWLCLAVMSFVVHSLKRCIWLNKRDYKLIYGIYYCWSHSRVWRLYFVQWTTACVIIGWKLNKCLADGVRSSCLALLDSDTNCWRHLLIVDLIIGTVSGSTWFVFLDEGEIRLVLAGSFLSSSLFFFLVTRQAEARKEKKT